MDNHLSTALIEFSTNDKKLSFTFTLDSENNLTMQNNTEKYPENTDFGLAGLMSLNFFNYLQTNLEVKDDVKETK